MWGATRNLYSSKLSHPSGGNVYCGGCGCVTGKIDIMNYKYIKYFFSCKCGNVGKVELYRGIRPWRTRPMRPLYNKDGVYICQNCEMPLFEVKEEAVDNYGFAVICKCGVEYDIKFKRKQD